MIENAKTKPAPNLAEVPMALTNVFKELPPREPLFLILEDDVLRHAPDRVLIRGVSDEEPQLPPSIEAQRRDLVQKIEALCCERARAYHGTLRPEK